MNEIKYDLDFDDYLSVDAISSSAMKRFRDSPYKYKHHIQEDKPHFRLGNAYHAAFLEPDVFKSKYVRSPYSDARGNKHKELVAECAGKSQILMSQKDYDSCVDMVSRVFDCSQQVFDVVNKLLRGESCKTEVSMFWVDEDTGLQCKGRADLINEEFGAIIDIKGISDRSGRGKACHINNVINTIISNDYHTQIAYYLDGLNACLGGNDYQNAIFLAIEKSYPYDFSLPMLDEEVIELGRKTYKKTLREIAECEESGVWPGPCGGIEMAFLPEWAA